MSKYYYDQPIIVRSWRNLIPTIAIIISMLSVYSFSLVGLKSNHGAQAASPQTAKSQPLAHASSTLSLKDNLTTEDLLQLTNFERQKIGIPVLNKNNLLENSATNKCQDMVTNNYWSHIDMRGLEPWHFITEAGYNKLAAGENLAYGFDNSKFVVQGWMNSPSHRAALLDKTYVDVGFGICTSNNFVGSGKQTIVVQHFGKPLP